MAILGQHRAKAWLVALGPDLSATSEQIARLDPIGAGAGMPSSVVAQEILDVLHGCQVLSGDPLRVRRFMEELFDQAGSRSQIRIGDLFGHLRRQKPSQEACRAASAAANSTIPRTERAAAEAIRNAVFMSALDAQVAPRKSITGADEVAQMQDEDGEADASGHRMNA
ncbi:hypothetical protein [Roseomonas gilardii]|uniref:hypothetical protein n=1 Tax=Roseomonas gilardii TaxID=257708 RepID=UPI0011C07A23|nr:hypothetical protein [Roseomonas gilardii]